MARGDRSAGVIGRQSTIMAIILRVVEIIKAELAGSITDKFGSEIYRTQWCRISRNHGSTSRHQSLLLWRQTEDWSTGNNSLEDQIPTCREQSTTLYACTCFCRVQVGQRRPLQSSSGKDKNIACLSQIKIVEKEENKATAAGQNKKHSE
jgi:hypothetical protein